MTAVLDWLPVHRLALVVGVVVSVAAVWVLDRPRGRWGAALRRRFLLGVPWGTLTTALLVLSVYLFVQDGYAHWYAPVTIPFRAWSYFYPVGMLTSSFAHVGVNHLLGNLVGTITLGAVAEYAWGHYPRRRGASSFGSPRTNPFVRAFVAVPGAVFVVGLVTSLFALGPVIGFSAVVFAFAGFALVHRPYTTVLALTAGQVLRVVRAGLREPTLTAQARPSFSAPWWAGIAIQGHALGLLVGALLGVWLLHSRDEPRPSGLRVWTGAVLFAVAQSLWAVYWFRGGSTYVLFRAVGVGLVFVLAALLALTVSGSDRSLFGRDAAVSVPAGDSASLGSLSAWQTGAVVLLLAAAALSGPAVVVNAVSVSDESLPGDTVEVRDYEVTYAENVPNGMVSAVNVSAFGETTSVNTSGVIVRNPDRGIWTTAVTKSRLAFRGQVPVRVGGLGWRDTVYAVRRGWVAAGGNTTYRVVLVHDGSARPVFTAPPAQADPVIAGRRVAFHTRPDRFRISVTRDNETAFGPIPEKNETVTVGGVTFVREGRKVYAEYNRTRVQVGKRETYRGR